MSAAPTYNENTAYVQPGNENSDGLPHDDAIAASSTYSQRNLQGPPIYGVYAVISSPDKRNRPISPTYRKNTTYSQADNGNLEDPQYNKVVATSSIYDNKNSEDQPVHKLEDLEECIDEYFNRFCTMNRNKPESSRPCRDSGTSTPISKRLHPESQSSQSSIPSNSTKWKCSLKASDILRSMETDFSRLEGVRKKFQS